MKTVGLDHVPALDGLRGIAISLVLLVHCFVVEPTTFVAKAYNATASFGWWGVHLFFVLSGFLLTGVLLSTKGSRGYIRNFYIRRALRIFPLYYAFLLGYFFVHHDGPWTQGYCYWAYLANYREVLPGCSHAFELAPLWSLSVEEQFYLLLPVTVALTSMATLRRVLLLAAIGSALVRAVVVLRFHSELGGYLWTPTNLDGFAVGALLASWCTDARGLEVVGRISPVVFAGSGAFFLGLGIAFRQFGWWGNPTTMLTVGIPAVILVSAAAIGLSLTSSAIARLLSATLLRRLGKYSYAIYIFHLPVFIGVRSLLRTWRPTLDQGSIVGATLIGIAAIFTSYGLALLSWNLLEKRALSLKHRFAPRRAPPRAPEPMEAVA